MAVNKSVYYKRLNKWADALVSRKYKQGLGKLKDKDGKFCCLGVACDLSGIASWDEEGAYLGCRGGADPKVASYYGFENYFGKDVLSYVKPNKKTGDLTTLNDGGKSFGYIAKIIRKFAEIKYGPSSKKTKKSKT